MNSYTYTTQAAVRAAFWNATSSENSHQYRRNKRQNDYPADIRMEWVEFIDYAEKYGLISEALAQRVTL